MKHIRLTAIISLILCASSATFGQSASVTNERIVERMEPSQWWTGMHFTEVQIMLYGKQMAYADVSLQGLQINRRETTSNPNYLFLYVETKGASAGTYYVKVQKGDEAGIYPFTLKLREPKSALRESFSPADAVYLLMPDRFANGNPSNDSVLGYYQGVNRSDLATRHGGDIQGIIEKVPYIADLGCTALWTTPMLDNNTHQYSYHHYGTTDYYKIDTRLGTEEDYRRLADVCHINKLKLIIDIVPNHCSKEHWWMKDIPAFDWFNTWSSYTPTSYRMNAWTDPHASEYDKKQLTKGWFAPDMPDFNLDNPLLFDYLCQAYVYWIEKIGIDGIRVDTYPYNNIRTAALFIESIRKEYPRMTVVGECWLKTPAEIAFYQSGNFNTQRFDSKMQSVMDFVLKDVFETALLETEAWDKGTIRFYNHYAQDFVYRNPNLLMNFLDNHDITRYSQVTKYDKATYLMALSLLVTSRGYPQIYYGDEIMLAGSDRMYEGSRSDFPGGWASDKRNAFTDSGRTPDENEIFRHLQRLLHFRKTTTALQTGKMMQFIPENGIYTYFRYDDDATIMVVTNNNATAKTLDLARFAETNIAGHRAVDVTTQKQYQLDQSIEVPARTVLVLAVQ